MMTNLDALAAEIHENAVAHGFWEAHDAEEVAFEMLHCEICEAIQADREGQAGVWYETPASGPKKPEGTIVELADFAIRLLDFAAWAKIPLQGPALYLCAVPDELYRLAFPLHDMVCSLSILAHTLRNDAVLWQQSVLICRALAMVEQYTKARGYDFEQIVRMKMDYNRTRPRLHGKRY